MELTDTPVFTHLAYQLDVSRCRVPTLETVGWLIETLAELRFTELQFYVEHTYAYEGHNVVWGGASPLTADDLAWIRDCAADAGIELVANLNCFGHMERWLRHWRYRSMAECPDGYPSLLGDGISPPSCLAPTEENARFAVGLARELQQVVDGRRIMIGGDEPFELGLGRSRDRVDRIGRNALYREHLERIIAPLVADGLEVMIWGDQIACDAAAVSWVPDGVTVVPWTYEAPGRSWRGWLPAAFEERLGLPGDADLGFEAHVRLLADGGVPFRVAAGTSTWGTLIGRNGNAAANIADAVEVGVRRGAEGLVVCDWGDHGHWQPLAVSLPSLVRARLLTGSHLGDDGRTGDGVATATSADVGPVIDRLLGAEAGTGALLDELGHLGERLGPWTPNGTPLGAAVFDRVFPVIGDVDPGAVADAIDFVTDVEPRWAELLPQSGRGPIIAAELSAVCRAALLALRRLAGQTVTEIDVDEVRRAQAAAWLASSRPGGLAESSAYFR